MKGVSVWLLHFKGMKRFLIFLILLMTTAEAQEVQRVEAQSDKGFQWPYYYYVPEHRAKGPLTVLVLPNNSGKSTDDFAVQEASALERTEKSSRKMAEKLGVVVLRPVFPRTRSEWYCYTHALDRDTLLSRRSEIERLDLQLLAMVDHLRDELGEPTRGKFLIAGFSASAMFANRFTLIHPERVLGVAVGSPGGWPIAPLAEFKGERLRYPVGVGDFRDVTGSEFDAEALREVPMFFFLGDQDFNDSVPYGDGYDPQDKDLVFELFGKDPVVRWPVAEKLYRGKAKATFNLYEGGEHFINKEMKRDMELFFRSLLERE